MKTRRDINAEELADLIGPVSTRANRIKIITKWLEPTPAALRMKRMREKRNKGEGA